MNEKIIQLWREALGDMIDGDTPASAAVESMLLVAIEAKFVAVDFDVPKLLNAIMPLATAALERKTAQLEAQMPVNH